MKFKENISAFKTGFSSTHPLLQIYSKLIVLELVLYETAPTGTHKIVEKIRTFMQTLATTNQGVLSALLLKLDTNLSKINFLYRDGTVKDIKIKHYPGIRYTLHEKDRMHYGAFNITLEADINSLNDVISEVIEEARRQGLPI